VAETKESGMSEVRFYCHCCEQCQPVTIGRLRKGDARSPKTQAWADILCKACSLVIATVEADEEGEYEIRRKGNAAHSHRN